MFFIAKGEWRIAYCLSHSAYREGQIAYRVSRRANRKSRIAYREGQIANRLSQRANRKSRIAYREGQIANSKSLIAYCIKLISMLQLAISP